MVPKQMLSQDYFGGAEGGAIYNKGDIIVDGEAEFKSNVGGVSSVMCSKV